MGNKFVLKSENLVVILLNNKPTYLKISQSENFTPKLKINERNNSNNIENHLHYQWKIKN